MLQDSSAAFLVARTRCQWPLRWRHTAADVPVVQTRKRLAVAERCAHRLHGTLLDHAATLAAPPQLTVPAPLQAHAAAAEAVDNIEGAPRLGQSTGSAATTPAAGLQGDTVAAESARLANSSDAATFATNAATSLLCCTLEQVRTLLVQRSACGRFVCMALGGTLAFTK